MSSIFTIMLIIVQFLVWTCSRPHQTKCHHSRDVTGNHSHTKYIIIVWIHLRWTHCSLNTTQTNKSTLCWWNVCRSWQFYGKSLQQNKNKMWCCLMVLLYIQPSCHRTFGFKGLCWGVLFKTWRNMNDTRYINTWHLHSMFFVFIIYYACHCIAKHFSGQMCSALSPVVITRTIKWIVILLLNDFNEFSFKICVVVTRNSTVHSEHLGPFPQKVSKCWCIVRCDCRLNFKTLIVISSLVYQV